MSFDPITQGNCTGNAEQADALERAAVPPMTVDLENCNVAAGELIEFSMAAEARQMLLHGLDPVALILRPRVQIEAFRRADQLARPWAH